MKVEVYMDIPASKFHRLAKKRIRERDVVVEGVNWPKASAYCPKGHWAQREVAGNAV